MLSESRSQRSYCERHMIIAVEPTYQPLAADEARFTCPAQQPRAELVEARLEPASALRPSGQARGQAGSGRGRDCVDPPWASRVGTSARLYYRILIGEIG